jgi:DNA polymerase-3 subunit delta
MQIQPDQLESRLRGELVPVYLISGDDPLRVMEAADAVRARARAAGFDEREVLSVTAGFDWNSLTAAAGNLSLFASRRIIDLRMPGSKPGDAGAKALRAYAEAPPEDTLLLITAGKLEPSARKSRWVQALDNAGAVVFVWPLDSRQLPAWVRARMQRRGLEATPEAATLNGWRATCSPACRKSTSCSCCRARGGSTSGISPARLPTVPASMSIPLSTRHWQETACAVCAS